MKSARPPVSDKIRTIVAKHPFCKGLKSGQISDMTALATEAKFKPDDVLITEGQPADRFILIIKGAVALDAHYPDQERSTILTLNAGDALGWSWIMKPFVWHFDARAIESTQTLQFEAEKLRALCAAKPKLGCEIYRRIAQLMLQRLQASRLQMLDWYGKND